MKKPIFILVLVLSLALFVSCGGSSKDEPDSDVTPATDDEPAADDEPVTDDEPATDDEPVTDSEPATDDEPVTDDEPATDNEPATDDDPEEPEPVPLHIYVGKYHDDWGMRHVISNDKWYQSGYGNASIFEITQIDTENNVIIAQNAATNQWNAGLWSKFDITIYEDNTYYCQTVFNAESEEAAVNTPSAAHEDPTDLTDSCGGSPWSMLFKEFDESINKDDAKIVAWATGYENYLPGGSVDEEWQTPDKALGAAVGDSYDIVCLGSGGEITMTFSKPITNGEGADFAVFENSAIDGFWELAKVSVSSDGEHFFTFDNFYLGANPVGAFGTHDWQLIHGLATQFMQGEGTLFDLDELATIEDDNLDLDAITHVKITDIIGDGSVLDTMGNKIYDPYPTTGSAGFDLDAVGVINQAE